MILSSLRRLHQPIEPVYRHWAGVPGLDGNGEDPEGGGGDDDDEDEDEEEEEEENDDEDGMEQDAEGDGASGEGSSETSSALSSTDGGSMPLGSFVLDHYLSQSSPHSAGTSLASSTQPFGSAASSFGVSAGMGMSYDGSQPSLTASNVLLASQGQGIPGTLPFRRPRQYSVGSTGSF